MGENYLRDKNARYDRHAIIGFELAMVAMIIYTFDADTYTSDEVNGFDEKTCVLLYKHDKPHVSQYKYETKTIDNYSKAMNNAGKFVYVRAFEK